MKGPVLVCGANGFLGARLAPALRARGVEVRCGTPRLEGAPLPESGCCWMRADPDDPPSLRTALEGCEATFYLVDDADLDHARAFARACERTGVQRIVYLGPLQTEKPPSARLEAHLRVGEVLRTSAVKTVELRAGLIVGHGVPAWRIVRDLAARMPALILPRWTGSRLQPVAIDDVVIALVQALFVPLHGPQVHDLPGPETLSLRQIIERTARLRGKAPRSVRVPLVSPWLSSLWLRVVSSVDGTVAEDLIEELSTDLLSHDRGFWPVISHEAELLPFDEAVRRAFEDEELAGDAGFAERALERFAEWMTRRAA